MKKIVLGILLLSVSLFAKVQHIQPSPDFFDKDIPVIDIRTPDEWKQTGIVKGSHTIMFFDERGNYNVEKFLAKLDKVIKKDKPFVLICRTGSRTAMIADFLDKDLGYKVINVQGGIMLLMQKGYRTTPYQ